MKSRKATSATANESPTNASKEYDDVPTENDFEEETQEDQD
ncbi:MAG: hypothetical protein WB763_13955 [Terriglobia bacterium]|jgi:hypothetical protein